MESEALASAAFGAQNAKVQMAVAAKMMKINAEQDANVVKIIDQAQKSAQSLANVAAGVGQVVDFEV